MFEKYRPEVSIFRLRRDRHAYGALIMRVKCNGHVMWCNQLNFWQNQNHLSRYPLLSATAEQTKSNQFNKFIFHS